MENKTIIKFIAYNQPHIMRLVGWLPDEKCKAIINDICNTGLITEIIRTKNGNNEK